MNRGLHEHVCGNCEHSFQHEGGSHVCPECGIGEWTLIRRPGEPKAEFLRRQEQLEDSRLSTQELFLEWLRRRAA